MYTMRRRRGGAAGVLIGLLVALALFAVIVGGCAISGYNHVVSLDERVKGAWAEVENQLKRRYDLIPNAMETVKGYAEHESEIFTSLAESRERYFSAGSREQQMQASMGLERALSRLLVLREQYPELKAQQSFQDFMTQLEGTENRVTVARNRYNEAVENLNRYRRQALGRMFAALANVEAAEYFEAPEGEDLNTAPQVQFGDTAPAATQPATQSDERGGP